MDSDQSIEFQFRKQLEQQNVSKKKNSVLISKTEYFQTIQDLKNANNAETKESSAVSYLIKVCD